MDKTTVTTMTPGAVAALWAEVLGLARLGADEALARYRPDSVDTTRVVARLRRAGHEVPFRTAYEAGTARELAGAIAALGRAGGASGASGASGAPGVAGGREQLGPEAPFHGWPLTHDQRRLWQLERRAGGAGNHPPVILRLRGELDRAALSRAWSDVVARHGSLRTRFVPGGREPRQEVLVPAPVTLDEVELPGADLADVLTRVAELAGPAFDLTAAPPWRAVLYRLGDEDSVLAIVVHRIVFDGWSELVLRRELCELYAAHRAGRPSRLPGLAVQYTDHAGRQGARLEEDLAGQLRYWRDQLAGSTQLDLPSDRPRPQGWSGEGAASDFTVDARLTAGVRALSRAHGATPFMTLLAAWSALLGRLCGSRDVVVGATSAERGSQELEDLIGAFENVLAIRTRLASRQPVTTLLAGVRETAIEALAHRDVPFERLVAELAPDGADPQLLNVNFAYLSMPAQGESWPGLRVRRLWLPAAAGSRPAAFDLALAVRDQPDGTLRCRLEYRTALFDPATIERIGRCYRRMLAAFVANPGAAAETLDILGGAERAALLAQASTGAAALPPECLHTVVQRQAGLVPDAVAVACGDVELSYAELDRRANRLANYLRGHGVGPEAGVAVRLPRSADQVVAMLAVWRAGGYYVPLDDEHPAGRIAMMLADAAPAVLITRGAERIASGEATGRIKVTCLGRDAADIAAQPPTPPAGVTVSPDALAAAIYTSGSTGTPKAVALSHRNVLSAQVSREAYRAQPSSLLLPVSFAFDVFLSFAAWALCAGGRVVIPVQPRGTDLDELAELLRRHRVTHLIGPPDLQRALLARDDVRGRNHLAIGVVGGQTCPGVLAGDYALATGGARLVNEYGLTETSAGTWFSTDGRDGAAGGGGAAGQLPIGRPATNYRVYVLDANLQPVPDGVTGEVYVGGPGVARGYLGRPGLTAARFGPDPFGPDPFSPGARLYRTGDLARRRGDGLLEFLGRRDQQVKVRGFRIELAEVEAALLRHASVGAAAVVHLPERQQLVAYVVGAGGAAPGGGELRAHAQRVLPEPMVPAAFRALPAMPLTPNGKIDRAALAALGVPEPVDETPALPAQVRTAERTAAERAVAEVWGELLEADPDGIDVHADFFKVGGHSLLAAGVVSRLRARFPVPIAMQDLFGSPTVAGLAELIAARVAGEPVVDPPAAGDLAAGEPLAAEPLAGEPPAAVRTGTPAAATQAREGCLEWLCRDGTATPLFCVHPGDGGTYWYADLAAALAQPLAALRWPDRHDGDRSIEAVARRYLAELRAAWPSGPYRVLGWCGGTPVTWELARLLRDAGEQVRLWLIDPLVDVARRPESPRRLALFREAEELLDDPASGQPAAQVASGEGRQDALYHAQGGSPARQIRAGRELLEAGIEYAFRPYRGRLRLLIGDEVPTAEHVVMGGQDYQQFLARWGELATGGIEVHRVRGDHYGVLRPPLVAGLAAVLAGELDGVRL